jgi:hypothetical protein
MSKYSLSFPESVKVIDSAIQQGQSLIELIQTKTGITTQHLALLADQLLQKLRTTTYELIKAKSMTGNTKPPIERSLSKSLVLFLHELNEGGGDCHYGTIRDKVQANYELTCNDYSTLKYYRLIEKSKTGNGYWQINERGQRFLSGDLKLSEKVTIQNDKVIHASNNHVTVEDFIDLNEYPVSDFLIEKRRDGLSRWK